jgi:hypothetical protein
MFSLCLYMVIFLCLCGERERDRDRERDRETETEIERDSVLLENAPILTAPFNHNYPSLRPCPKYKSLAIKFSLYEFGQATTAAIEHCTFEAGTHL